MTTHEKNAMMYRIVKAQVNVDFKKNFYTHSQSEIYQIGRLAELFNIKSRNGASPARTLFYRLAEYEKWLQKNI